MITWRVCIVVASWRVRVAMMRTRGGATLVIASKAHHVITQLHSLQCMLNIVDPVPENVVLTAQILRGRSLITKLLG
jgi:hypothetical protein